MQASLEVTISPFREGERVPEHVEAAMEVLRAAGLHVDLQAFAVVASGEIAAVIAALPRALEAALAAEATKIALSLEVRGDG